MNKLSKFENTVIVWTDGSLPRETYEFLDSSSFAEVVGMFLDGLRFHGSHFLNIFPEGIDEGLQADHIISLFKSLYYQPADEVLSKNPQFSHVLADRYLLHQFIEHLYNFWRGFERYIVCSSSEDFGFDKRPYRTFRDTISHMNHLVRKAYRDISENLTGEPYRVYRQVSSGFSVGVIAAGKDWDVPADYACVEGVPFITQVLLYPPLIIDPLMNKRRGQFLRVDKNPLEGVDFKNGEWLCYPAKVGDLLIHIYFHNKFMGLGCSTANLFELAREEELRKKPDALFAFGVNPGAVEGFDSETVFFEDDVNDLLVAAIPGKDEYGYFGYLKKMVLTLHNISAMKRGRLPIHGAMVNIELKSGSTANVLILGDSGAGKSESLEAFRSIGDAQIRDMTIVFDDMGSVGVDEEGRVLAYGTEVGAFVRLDDLQPGFAFGNMDRSIIMSPQKTNARVVLPVTTIQEVLVGHRIDFFLYANNFEEVGGDTPIIERFDSASDALEVFSKGAVMSKGTTSTKGIVYNYFANIFGPPQYRSLHESLAKDFFERFFDQDMFVGQLRTRLGVEGFETDGPLEAAKALLDMIE